MHMICKEKATNENNVSEDWALFLEIVDEINQTTRLVCKCSTKYIWKFTWLSSKNNLYSEKEAIRIFTRRLNDRDPHIVAHTLPVFKIN
jgi:hypothetical protein